jgi:hypothetical protein
MWQSIRGIPRAVLEKTKEFALVEISRLPRFGVLARAWVFQADCGSTLRVPGLKLSGIVYSGATHMLTEGDPDPITRGLAIADLD